MIEEDHHFENEIYIGKRDVSVYFEKAKELLSEYEFIVLKSFAIYVSKAFSVAGLLAKELPRLKQINIPSTVEIRATSSKGSRLRTRGAIKIELSLHELNSRHIGYQ